MKTCENCGTNCDKPALSACSSWTRKFFNLLESSMDKTENVYPENFTFYSPISTCCRCLLSDTCQERSGKKRDQCSKKIPCVEKVQYGAVCSYCEHSYNYTKNCTSRKECAECSGFNNFSGVKAYIV